MRQDRKSGAKIRRKEGKRGRKMRMNDHVENGKKNEDK